MRYIAINDSHYCKCGRPARYYSLARRRYVYSPDHPLCRQCWQSCRDRDQASRA